MKSPSLLLAALLVLACSTHAMHISSDTAPDTSLSTGFLGSITVGVGALCAVLLVALCSSREKERQKVQVLLSQQRQTRRSQAGPFAEYDVPLRSTRSNTAGGSQISFGASHVGGGGGGAMLDDIKLGSEEISLGTGGPSKSTRAKTSAYQSDRSSAAPRPHASSSQGMSQEGYPRQGSNMSRKQTFGSIGGSGSHGYRHHGATSQDHIVIVDRSHGGTGQGNASMSSDDKMSKSDEETLDMWRLDETQVQTNRLLSRGAYGEVWLGEYRSTPVAIKKLLASRSTPDEMRKFVAEIVLMAKYVVMLLCMVMKWQQHGRLESNFIVKFIGVSWYRKAEMMLILEYMNQGDLRTMLERTTQDSFSLEAKLNCAMSVAEGLVYLHTLDSKIIHRDIKSRNVLLDSHKGTKLTDFGISRETTSETMTIGIGTYRWMAPEILTDSHYSHAADIYSFGVIMAELDTHLLPYSDQANEKGNPLNDTAIMSRVMQGTIQPTFSSLFPPSLLGLAKQCLSYKPEDRPTSMQISHQLFQLRKALAADFA
ncbi:Aste57867_17846 [Aphanomyces stellatus]|uniref:Aste57867_17846 protein n=1 Tax=Aphanomyces stellatus TaxID=120398 RepID=A0A485L8L3_9STRA|nr:hypothetical protein As57867_017785 [Aphanomyces stellatus]VFT94589.1 Aste57867_17846 [Aphanomyces stellatus]